jgi:hypothetical protein
VDAQETQTRLSDRAAHFRHAAEVLPHIAEAGLESHEVKGLHMLEGALESGQVLGIDRPGIRLTAEGKGGRRGKQSRGNRRQQGAAA